MATQRDDPYAAFNFIVTANRLGDAKSVRGGFQEVTGLGLEAMVAEYRRGNEPENHVRKFNTMYKTNDVTLKRGIIGVTDFYDWIKDVREGSQSARATVTIQLMDEAHTGPVMTWTLTNARPIKYTGPGLNAKTGTDVAMEELVLSSERLDVS